MNIGQGLENTLRIIAKTVGGIIAFVLLFLGTEYVLSSMTVNAKENEPHDLTIFIQTNGVHTDLVLPIKNQVYDWSQQIVVATTTSRDTSVKYIAIGWGDKGFYLETPSWAELKASTALKAALGLSATAMHCTFYTSFSEGENSKKIPLSFEQYKKLVSFINESFEWTADKKTILVNTDVRYDDFDTFYEAVGTYSIFKTCNTWTNQALKSANLKACYWAAFQNRIMEKYE